ncbi:MULTISPECIES: hypothetical protein [Halobacteriales]|uniref:Uncharacterized protein n=2 Tax=Halobacteriales TaxID=2235 RepID=A0A1I0QZF5_9EURY|nr:hypothetical protein [Natrinema salifodinae]SEW33054.1 hypothetical protein SAMN05216285_4195 [Natrinema salifodinae]
MQEPKHSLLRAKHALQNAKDAPVGDVLSEINEAQGFVDRALDECECNEQPSGDQR